MPKLGTLTGLSGNQLVSIVFLAAVGYPDSTCSSQEISYLGLTGTARIVGLQSGIAAWNLSVKSTMCDQK